MSVSISSAARSGTDPTQIQASGSCSGTATVELFRFGTEAAEQTKSDSTWSVTFTGVDPVADYFIKASHGVEFDVADVGGNTPIVLLSVGLPGTIGVTGNFWRANKSVSIEIYGRASGGQFKTNANKWTGSGTTNSGGSFGPINITVTPLAEYVILVTEGAIQVKATHP